MIAAVSSSTRVGYCAHVSMNSGSLRSLATSMFFGIFSSSPSPSGLRRAHDGVDDLRVARAAAEVPGDREADVIRRRLRLRREERRRAHEHPGGAEAALHRT